MNYEIFQLTDFDLTRLDVVQEYVRWIDDQDHSRWVLRTRREPSSFLNKELYVKIWNPTYVRRDNILEGIHVGFYDKQTTPALTGILFHKGICRGYVTHKCSRYWRRNWEKDFYSLIQKRTARTGHFAYQYSRYHVMRYKNQPSMIDLEGIYPIDELYNLINYHSKFDDKHYESYITDLYSKRYQRSAERPQIQTTENGAIERGTHFLWRGVRFLWNQPRAFLREKLQEKTLSHLNLIEI